ncbi:MAG TPA: glycosyltransferase [Roseiflexaceae bacterium]|nr:glycosyltransferase [Roseiflexaceae bacterium]
MDQHAAHRSGDPFQVSIACTVLNEADNIAGLLDSMLAQTRPADEIVINDCGSHDGTDAIVERYCAAGRPVRLVRGGHNIPSGRNNAIRHARGMVVACTDAGLTLDPRWLERIVAPIERGEADVVGGFFRPAPRSWFELVLGATNYREVDEVDPAVFLPFGQSVAFRRAAWEAVGGYPEWASHCEDLLFDMALRQAGFRFAFAPEALVHFRPRSSLRAFARQYYLYARGDGVAGLWPRRHAIRYATYLALAAVLARAPRHPWLLALPALGALAYTRAPLRRLRLRAPSLGAGDMTRAAALVALIRLVGDAAKMAGYPAGLLRRWCSPQLRAQVAAYWRSLAPTRLD